MANEIPPHVRAQADAAIKNVDSKMPVAEVSPGQDAATEWQRKGNAQLPEPRVEPIKPEDPKR